MAGFFPLFFKQYWSAGASVTESTFRLGIANSVASLVIVILAPLLGAIADRCGARKRFLLTFATLGILMTALLPWVAQGDWWLAVVLYVLATIGFSGSISFSDSLLVFVADKPEYERVSALGYALGYLGGGLLFAVNVWMTLSPQTFGLTDAAEAVKLSFFTVAIWWALFTLPLARYVTETDGSGIGARAAVVAGWSQLRETFREIRALRNIFLFLIAYWFYIDGVDTIVRMAVDYGLSLGFDSNSLIVALLITQGVGFPAALAFGWLGSRIGARSGIYIAIAVYIVVVIWAAQMEHVKEFYLLAVVIGLVQGGIQSLSRSLYAHIIPADKSAEFFGFYNMLGKFAAVLGPVMVGWASAVSGSPRLSMLTLLILFVVGALVLRKVDVDDGAQYAPRR
ncbi:MFS transporter [Candidatus Reidiella endopervernicosa]|nr:MFS transporter [Candidatus Reidiella endopervernicosa]